MASDSVTAPAQTRGRATHYWQLPVFALGVAAAALAAAKFPAHPDGPAGRFGRNVKSLRVAMDARPIDALALESLAATVAADPAADAGAKLLAGGALLAVAEQSAAAGTAPEKEVRDAWQRAAAQLAAVEPGSLAAPEDRKRLAFRQAKAQAALQAGDPKALAVALADLVPGEEAEGERRRLLADCYLRQVPPALKPAREELQQYLSSALRLPPAAAARARQQLAAVHLELKDPEKARACLKEIGPAAPADVQALAKAQLGRLSAAENRFAEAVGHFDAALAGSGLSAADRDDLRLRAALCQVRAKNAPAAVPYLEEAAKGTGPAAQAAGVRLAEVLLRDPRRPRPPRPGGRSPRGRGQGRVARGRGPQRVPDPRGVPRRLRGGRLDVPQRGRLRRGREGRDRLLAGGRPGPRDRAPRRGQRRLGRGPPQRPAGRPAGRREAARGGRRLRRPGRDLPRRRRQGRPLEARRPVLPRRRRRPGRPPRSSTS